VYFSDFLRVTIVMFSDSSVNLLSSGAEIICDIKGTVNFYIFW